MAIPQLWVMSDRVWMRWCSSRRCSTGRNWAMRTATAGRPPGAAGQRLDPAVSDPTTNCGRKWWQRWSSSRSESTCFRSWVAEAHRTISTRKLRSDRFHICPEVKSPWPPLPCRCKLPSLRRGAREPQCSGRNAGRPCRRTVARCVGRWRRPSAPLKGRAWGIATVVCEAAPLDNSFGGICGPAVSARPPSGRRGSAVGPAPPCCVAANCYSCLRGRVCCPAVDWATHKRFIRSRIWWITVCICRTATRPPEGPCPGRWPALVCPTNYRPSSFCSWPVALGCCRCFPATSASPAVRPESCVRSVSYLVVFRGGHLGLADPQFRFFDKRRSEFMSALIYL